MSVQRQYFAADGRQLTEDEALERGVVRDGVRVSTRLAFLDGNPQSITLTDAERAFADSPKGRAMITRDRARHDKCEAYKSNPAPYTDAYAAAFVRDQFGIVDSLEHVKAKALAAREASNAARSSAWRR